MKRRSNRVRAMKNGFRYKKNIFVKTQHPIDIVGIFLLCCFLFIHNNSIFPQHNLNFTHLTTTNGLPHSSIICMLQDSKGYMWFGTPAGLAKYDGYQYSVYKPDLNDTHSIAGDQIHDLMEDTLHNRSILWIACQGGISYMYLDNEEIHTIRYHPDSTSSINSPRLRCILKVENQKVWIGTVGGGINIYDPAKNSFEYIMTDPTDPHSISDNGIISFLTDSKGRIWIGTHNFFNKYNPSTKEFKRYQFKKSGEMVYCMNEDTEGNIWIGYPDGIEVFNPATESFLNVENLISSPVNPPGSEVRDIFFDKQDNIWIASIHEGLSFIDHSRTKANLYRHDPFDETSISSDHINKIFIDNNNVLWIGTSRGGLSKASLTEKGFNTIRKTFGTENTLSNAFVFSMAQESENILWVGTFYGGLNRYNRETGSFTHIKSVYGNESTLTTNTITSLLIDSENDLWAGSMRWGLNRIDLDKISIDPKQTGDVTKQIEIKRYYPGKYNTKQNIVGWSVRNIYEDRNGQLWISSWGGLNLYNRETDEFKVYSTETHGKKGLRTNNFWTVCHTHTGWEDYLWIGTENMGLARLSLKTDSFEHFINVPGDLKSLNDNSVRCIYQDTKNRLWLGTYAGGLNLLRFNENGNPEFKYYTKKDGLPNESVLSILEDGNGNLWLSTYNGIAKFNPENESFRVYYKSDGLQDNDFSYGAALKDRQGKFFFGGINGISYFHPDSITDNNAQDVVVITNFKLFNKTVQPYEKINKDVVLTKHISYTKEIKLSHRNDDFGFEFSSLNFAHPSKIKYMYKMVGYDKNWKLTDAQNRTATYTNLDAGEYQFRVKASNNNGIWSDQNTTLDILIYPAWWESWWASIIYFLLSLSIILYLRRLLLARAEFRNRLKMERLQFQQQQELDKKEHEIDQMKIRFFMNISHEFRTPLTLIIGPLESLLKKKSNDEATSQLNLILRNTRRLLRLINQLLDFRKLDTGKQNLSVSHGDIVEFVRSIHDAFKYIAEDHEIDYRFESNKNKFYAWFDPEKIEKALLNIISNAFKFTRSGGEICIGLFTTETDQEKEDQLKEFDGPVVVIEVSDTGKGIPRKNLDKIFERFYSSDKDDTQGGTGIGLSLTRELIELHKGEILVSSEPGKGSSFKIILPVGKKSYKKDEISREPQKGPSPELLETYQKIHEQSRKSYYPKSSSLNDEGKDTPLILVIDDNKDMLSFIRHELNTEYRIEEAQNGKEGVKMSIDHIPDLILCDVLMPEMDGLEFCTYIKNEVKTSHIPIILLTAKSAEEDQISGLLSGADDYITKPFNAEILKAKINNIIKSRKLLWEKFKLIPDASIKDIGYSSYDEQFLVKLNEVITQKFTDSELELKDIVREVGMSQAQLYRKIKSLTNLTVNEYIYSVRLKEAAHLLKSTTFNVSDIAYKVGYKNASHFTKSFRKHFGKSPSEYRK